MELVIKLEHSRLNLLSLSQVEGGDFSDHIASVKVAKVLDKTGAEVSFDFDLAITRGNKMLMTGFRQPKGFWQCIKKAFHALPLEAIQLQINTETGDCHLTTNVSGELKLVLHVERDNYNRRSAA